MAPAPLANGLAEHERTNTGGDTLLADSNQIRKIKEAERRRHRRKQKKKGTKNGEMKVSADDSGDESASSPRKGAEEQVQVEYVLQKPDLDESYGALIEVFEKLSSIDKLFLSVKDDASKLEEPLEKSKLTGSDDEDEDEQESKQKEKGLSNKKKKLARRMKIAELKQQCSKPDVVEVWDATAADPKLLVFLKAYRNTVPVPRHWCQKRKFLQGAAIQLS